MILGLIVALCVVAVPAMAVYVPVVLPSEPCPGNLNSCTANDVVTQIRSVEIVGGDICENAADTIHVLVRVNFSTTANERYDLGLYVATDGGTIQEDPVSTALTCVGAAAPLTVACPMSTQIRTTTCSWT